LRRWNTDCRFFEGERPCIHKRECAGCDLYSPMGRRVLVLKLGALGDVLRTTPALEALHADGPAHVTWVAGAAAAPLLAGNPRIDRLLTPGYETSERLGAERFDLLLSLDKDPYSTALATRVHAVERRGFGRDGNGSLVPLHPDAAYAYDLGLSDRLKFLENARTYQDVIFEVCGLPWRRQEYDVPAVRDRAPAGRAILRGAGVPEHGGPLVGLNTGAGGVFANKAWTIEGYAELARGLAGDGARVVLLGGPEDAERNRAIRGSSGGAALPTGEHSLADFAGLVACCDLVVTGDTLGMHLAIAARVPVIVLFGSTCAVEIELYGRGEKIVTPIDCHPCYRRTCDIHPSCQELIPATAVLEAARRVLSARAA